MFAIIVQLTWFQAILGEPYEVVQMLRETSDSEVGITTLKTESVQATSMPICMGCLCVGPIGHGKPTRHCPT